MGSCLATHAEGIIYREGWKGERVARLAMGLGGED